MTELLAAYVFLSGVITLVGLVWTVILGFAVRIDPKNYDRREIMCGLAAMLLGWAWPVVLLGVVLAGLGYAIKAVNNGV